MYDKIDFASTPSKGRRDNKRTHYLCLASSDPERIRLQRWEIAKGTIFGRAVSMGRQFRNCNELWSAAVVITKAEDGELHVAWANFAPLTGWAGDSCWYCWGARVLVGAILMLENESAENPDCARTWTAWREGAEDFYPKLLPTRIPSSMWPIHPREGSRTDEE